jgi:hypothetical protein
VLLLRRWRFKKFAAVGAAQPTPALTAASTTPAANTATATGGASTPAAATRSPSGNKVDVVSLEKAVSHSLLDANTGFLVNIAGPILAMYQTKWV